MRLVLVSLIFCLAGHSQAQVRAFQTTRLLSTSGAGVASMLVSESAVLNPAPLAFFNETFAAYQNTQTDIRSESLDREADGRIFPKSNRQEGYFLFDNASLLKGGFSYQYQRENGFIRKRGTVTMASTIAENISLGVIYRYTDDLRPIWYGARHKVSHPVTFGFSWIPLTKLTVGAVWDDPGRATPGESRAITGVQYGITGDLMVIFDIGADPTRDVVDQRLWRGALQYKLFADFYVRGGKFEDRIENLEGESWGASWAGPKLGVDFAMKTSRQIQSKTGYLYKGEKLSDVSFNLNLRF